MLAQCVTLLIRMFEEIVIALWGDDGLMKRNFIFSESRDETFMAG